MRQNLVFVLSWMMAAGCGRHSFPDYRPEEPYFERVDGQYSAKFKSLNVAYVGETKGHMVVSALKNQFYVKLEIQNHIPAITHHQYIHKSKFCPSRSADTNHDGIIDFEEILNCCGMALIPLDRNLRSRVLGFDTFPVADETGKYYYSQSTSMYKMLSDLRGYPYEPNSYFTRLEYGEYLDLDQKVVIIYGNGKDDLFPIACAEIVLENTND